MTDTWTPLQSGTIAAVLVALLASHLWVVWWVWANVAVAVYGLPPAPLWHLIAVVTTVGVVTSRPAQQATTRTTWADHVGVLLGHTLVWWLLFWLFWMGT